MDTAPLNPSGSSSAASGRPPATASPPQKRNRMAPSQAARTSMACQMCRDKKVKCSGDQPCRYCSRRRLKCVFSSSDNRKKLFFSSLQEPNMASCENQERDTDGTPQLQRSLPPPQTTPQSAKVPHGGPQPQNSTHQSAEVFHGGTQQPVEANMFQIPPNLLNSRHEISFSSHPSSSPLQRSGADDLSSTTSNRAAKAIAPESALSSSETFGTEVKTLLVGRSNPGSASASAAVPLPQVDLSNWPTEEDAHIILETVVLNVGVSQQLFDVRVFSDNLSLLYQNANADVHVPQLWVVQALLVFAIGRLLQARTDSFSQLPGTAFFKEAMKQLPNLTELRTQGIAGIEVMGLAALYLQIVDRKEDAYMHASTALRLAICQGMHRANSTQKLRRSEAVHYNRLWWTIYMQERRLAAACGHPMAISDESIHANPPSDFAGFTSVTAIAVNVRAARITGQITSTIYSQSIVSEASFILKVQSILYSLHEVENTMPTEYSMEFRPSGLILAGRRFSDSPHLTARTSSSLYLSIYQAVIHAVRPVLLYLARESHDRENEAQNEPSPTLKRLAEVCVEAASKSLVILQELRKQDILAKHAFLDLDAIFSVGFIFVLVEVINPGKDLGSKGINGSRALLRYLVALGNQAAAKRLAEIDQMCTHLSLPLQPGYGTVTQMHAAASPAEADASSAAHTFRSYLEDFSMANASNESLQQIFSNADLPNIFLEGENDIYGVYHDPDFSFTGVDLADWEALENQITWN